MIDDLAFAILDEDLYELSEINKKDIDIKERDDLGRTALMIAAGYGGYVEIV